MHHTRMADCVDISDQSASAAAQAAWDASIAKVREGTRLYLTNDFARAEEIFKQGMGQSVGGSAALKGSKTTRRKRQMPSMRMQTTSQHGMCAVHLPSSLQLSV